MSEGVCSGRLVRGSASSSPFSVCCHDPGVATRLVPDFSGRGGGRAGGSDGRRRGPAFPRWTLHGGEPGRCGPLHRFGLSGVDLLAARLRPHQGRPPDGGGVRSGRRGGLRVPGDLRVGRNRGRQLWWAASGRGGVGRAPSGAATGAPQLRSLVLALSRHQRSKRWPARWLLAHTLSGSRGLRCGRSRPPTEACA